MKRSCVVVPVEDKRQVYRLMRWIDYGDKLYLTKNDDGSIVMMTIHSNHIWYGMRYTPAKKYEFCRSMTIWSPKDLSGGKFIADILGVRQLYEIPRMSNDMVKLNVKSPIFKLYTEGGWGDVDLYPYFNQIVEHFDLQEEDAEYQKLSGSLTNDVIRSFVTLGVSKECAENGVPTRVDQVLRSTSPYLDHSALYWKCISNFAEFLSK